MPIPFSCAGCKKAFKAPDHLAGKKVSCPSCKVVGTVPATSPDTSSPAVAPVSKRDTEIMRKQAQTNGSGKHQSAPPPPPIDPEEQLRREADAMQSLLDDERQAAEASQAKSIDFECDNCGEPISVALDQAGKRTPCPSCARIVKVPAPARRDSADWKAKPQFASAVKLQTEEKPEGAWDATSKLVSREALEDADALPVRKAPVPLGTRVRQYLLVAAVLAIGGVIGLSLMRGRSRTIEAGKVETVLADIADPGKNKLDKAALEMMAARALLEQEIPNKLKTVEKHISQAIAALNESPASTARGLVAADMAENLAAMMGTNEDEKDGKKPQANFLQRTIGTCLGKIDDAEWRLDAWGRICRALLASEQSERMVVLEGQIFRGQARQTNRNNETIQPELEAAAITGLALLEEGNRKNRDDLKEMALRSAESLKSRGEPSSFPSLAIGLYGWRGKELPGSWGVAKSDPEQSGIVLARAAQGNIEAARKIVDGIANEAPEAVRARVALAEGMLVAGKADSDVIKKIVDDVSKLSRGRTMFAMQILRLARVAERSGVPQESLKNLAGTVTGTDSYDVEVRGAILVTSLSRGIMEKQPLDSAPVDAKLWSAWATKTRLALLARAPGGPMGDGQGTELFARMGRLMPPFAIR
jgi:DNA-directed RNA polymerase subunit RPC12/RpoP